MKIYCAYGVGKDTEVASSLTELLHQTDDWGIQLTALLLVVYSRSFQK